MITIVHGRLENSNCGYLLHAIVLSLCCDAMNHGGLHSSQGHLWACLGEQGLLSLYRKGSEPS